jgi:hypothetical protein
MTIQSLQTIKHQRDLPIVSVDQGGLEWGRSSERRRARQSVGRLSA